MFFQKNFFDKSKFCHGPVGSGKKHGLELKAKASYLHCTSRLAGR